MTSHHSYVRLAVKRASVWKRTVTNYSVDNRTQTKFFNHKSSLIVLKQDHRFTCFDPKTRSYLPHKSIPRGLSVKLRIMWQLLSCVFEWKWQMKGYINYMKLTNGKLITQMLVKMSLFVTNKVFREIIVTTCRFAYFTYSNRVTIHSINQKVHIKILLSRTNVVSRDFINIYISQTHEKPRNHRVFK